MNDESMELGEILQDKTLVYGNGDNAITILLLKQQIGLGLIGMISSKRFDQNIALVVNEDNPAGSEYGPAYHGSLKDGTGHRVGMDATLIDDLRTETPESLMILFHELGHLANHDAVAVGQAAEQHNQARKNLASTGHVHEMELLADDFAAEYLGVESIIAGLEAFIEREAAEYSPDEYEQEDIDVMLEELRLRITHQRGKTKKDG